MTARVSLPRLPLAPRSDVATPRAATPAEAPGPARPVLAEAPPSTLDIAASVRSAPAPSQGAAPAPRERVARPDDSPPARPSTSPATPTTPTTPTARPPDAPIAIRWSVDAEGPTSTPDADTDTDVEPAADETTKAPSRIAGKRTAADGPAPSASAPSTTGHEGTLTPGSERAASTARSTAPAGSDTSAASARTADLALRVVPGFEAQLAARAKELLARGQTEIRVTLDPPSLGRLRVRLLLTDTDAVAHISAGSPEAAALLHRERAELARAFEQQGFSRVEVHVDAGAGGRSGEDADRPASDASAVTEPEPVSSSASRPAGRVDLFV